MRDRSELDRNDREAGRQLLVVSLPIGIGVVVLAFFVPEPTILGAAIFAVVVNVLCFVNPVAAIRIASGRFAELFPRPEPPRQPAHDADDDEEDDGDDDDVEPRASAPRGGALEPVRAVLEAQQEGTPMEVALLERELSKRRRRWTGIGLMIVGTSGCVLGMALGSDSRVIMKITGGVAFVGLVLWYRTL